MYRFALLTLCLFALPATAKPLVLTTIRPLTLIVAAIAGEAVEVRQLLPDGDSPHHWALKMSDRRLIDRADLLLWVGPDMESALADAVAQRRGETVTAIALPQLQWPPPAADPARPRDPHVWLHPANATVIAAAVADWLGRSQPERAPEVRSALRRFADLMARTQASTAARLAAVSDRAFVVDHDALQHFVVAFGLRQAGHLTDAGDRAIGAREMDRLLTQTDIRCLVVEPGRGEQMRALARRLGARLVAIDHFGTDVRLGVDAYARFLEGIGERLAGCLAEPLR